MRRHVHFVGFRTDREFLSATLAFGKADFIHLINDHRSEGDIADGDLVIFGSKATEEKSKFSDQDHERF